MLPWWANRQLAPCTHVMRTHELLDDHNLPRMSYAACIICGDRPVIVMKSETYEARYENPFERMTQGFAEFGRAAENLGSIMAQMAAQLKASIEEGEREAFERTFGKRSFF